MPFLNFESTFPNSFLLQDRLLLLQVRNDLFERFEEAKRIDEKMKEEERDIGFEDIFEILCFLVF